ncbi:MAG TPA: lytic transglycosylase domain-containing protein, partial [Beijerinckiaceae bacterium]|nr:lytic transglycosylase domain-containing protein [Beijerinckiaceae bacterium]
MSAAATALRAAGLRAAALALALLAPAGAAAQGTESVHDALCRLISGSAAEAGLPVDFLTRLIWQESSFRPHVTSRAGAQGVAQFMPGTAAERGLADPFDPEQAIPAAAALLRDLRTRFGNLGLAAAAYNGGPARLSAWLAGTGGLPAETRAYVAAITGRTAEDWAAEREDVDKAAAPPAAGGGGAGVPTCPETLVALRVRPTVPAIAESPFAPWGV